MALEDKEMARVELNRLYATQQYLVSEEYVKEINRDQDKIKRLQGRHERRLDNSDATMSRIDSRLSAIHQDFSGTAAYAPYVNPFAAYLKAIFEGTNGSRENARVMMNKVNEFGQNPFVKAELELLESGTKIENVTYVIFESNMAPFRTEEMINFMVYIPVEVGNVNRYGQSTSGTRTELVPIEFSFFWPKLKDKGQRDLSQYIIIGDKKVRTELLADMESIVAKEFNNRWPGVKNRIVLSVVAKATAAVVGAVTVKKTIGSGLLGTLAAWATGSATTHYTKGTDSRTWRTLPSNFQICRIPTPANRKIMLSSSPENHGNHRELELVDGSVNVVYIKQTSPESILMIHQFKLK